ncbi:MAG: AAA family ATPase [Lachnospiraceae bacterium]|nr:AAA family ATPase [Lachnospiraceae bacterium]
MGTCVICFANNKGGSGKTTTCANTGSALSLMGRKVLLIDGDMQMNLTLSFFGEDDVLEFAESGRTVYEAIVKEEDLSSYIRKTDDENIDVIPASTLLTSIEMDLFTKIRREFLLSRLLKKVKDSGDYDYILIDAPPTLGNWVMNILIASDRVMIPVEATPWGLFGLANMTDFIGRVQEIAPGLDILGIVVTKADERKNYYKQMRETLSELDEIHVFESVIHVDSSVEWAQDASSTVVKYKRSSRSAKEYMQLAKEVDGLCQ